MATRCIDVEHAQFLDKRSDLEHYFKGQRDIINYVIKSYKQCKNELKSRRASSRWFRTPARFWKLGTS